MPHTFAMTLSLNVIFVLSFIFQREISQKYVDYLDQQKNGDPVSWGNHHPVSGNKEEKYLKGKEHQINSYGKRCTDGQPRKDGQRTQAVANSCVCVSVTQPCPTLCDSIDCSPSDSPVHGILQQEHWSG